MKRLLLILLLIPSLSFAAKWEEITSGGDTIARLETPHGWLVRVYGIGGALTYIPDEKHEWKIDK